MKSPSPVIVLGVSVLFLGTFVIGWSLAPDAVTRTSTDAGDMRTERAQPRERHPRSDTGVSAKMNRIRNAVSPVEKSRAAISLAMSLDPSEFAAWVEGDRFSARNGPELSIFRMILFERWAAEAPDSLIAWGIRNDYGQAGRALDTFAKHDPERLINHFREHPDNALEIAQLKDIGTSHPALALARLQELYAEGVSSKLDRQSREVLLALSKNSTVELEAALGSLPESIRGQAESVLIGRKLEKDFEGEIGKLFDHPQGAEILIANLSLIGGRAADLIAAVPNMPESWKSGFANRPWQFFQSGHGKEWLGADLVALGFSEAEADRIREAGYSYLSYSSPDLVLRSIRDSVKSGTTIEKTLGRLYDTGQNGEERARQSIAGITDPEVKKVAEAHLEALVEGAKLSDSKSPSELFRNLEASGAITAQTDRVASLVRNLKDEELQEYRAGFEGLSPEVKTKAAISIAKSVSNYSSSNPMHGDAIRHLAENPPASDPAKPAREQFKLSESAANYTIKVAKEDPVAASEWVGSLPEGETRLWAARNLAGYWNQYDPAAASGWMKTLSNDERAQVAEHLENPW